VEYLIIGVQYIDREGFTKEHLFVIVDSESKKGADIEEEILRNFGSKLIEEKLAFQCYDFASNISKHFDGTDAHISKKFGRNIQYLRCLAHRGNIIIPFVRNLPKVLEVTLSLPSCSL